MNTAQGDSHKVTTTQPESPSLSPLLKPDTTCNAAGVRLREEEKDSLFAAQRMATPVPDGYAVGCWISAVGLAATLAHHRQLVRGLRARTAFSAKRLLYRLITGLAPALAVVNVVAVTSPPMHKACAVAQHVIVAFVMTCFMELLLLLCFRISLAEEASGGEASLPGINNILEHFEASFSSLTPALSPSHFMTKCVAVLAQQPDINFWASPPIGCCFALCPSLPCGKRHRPSALLLVLLRRAIFAYVLGVTVAPVLETWVDGVPGISEDHRVAAKRAANAVETGVTVLALYALFITYRLSRAPLHSYHTTLKFAAVKILVFLSPLQRLALTSLLGASAGPWWHHVLMVAECPLLSYLLGHAFPASELPSAAAAAATQAVPDSDDEVARLI